MNFVATLTIVVVFVAVAVGSADAQVTPRGFAPCYFMVAARNLTVDATGEKLEHQALREWAADRNCAGNADGRRKKTTECNLGNHVSEVSIHIENIIWLFSTERRVCEAVIMPVAPTNHTWAVDGTYLGSSVLREVPVYSWVKDNHYWYETQVNQRPIGFTFPTDGFNFGEEWFAHYEVTDYARLASRFEIPDFCPVIPSGTYEDLIARQDRRRRQGEPLVWECFQNPAPL